MIRAKRDRAKTLYDEGRTGGASFEASSQADQYSLLAAAQRAKQVGIGNLSPEEKQLLLSNSLSNEFATKGLSESSENNPALQQFKSLIGRGSQKDLKQQVDNLAAEADTKVSLIRWRWRKPTRRRSRKWSMTCSKI